jgi:hypothetical protein
MSTPITNLDARCFDYVRFRKGLKPTFNCVCIFQSCAVCVLLAELLNASFCQNVERVEFHLHFHIRLRRVQKQLCLLLLLLWLLECVDTEILITTLLLNTETVCASVLYNWQWVCVPDLWHMTQSFERRTDQFRLTCIQKDVLSRLISLHYQYMRRSLY